MKHKILESCEVEITPQNLDDIVVVNLQHDTACACAEYRIVDVNHSLAVEPGLNIVALDADAQGVPLALLENVLLLVGNLDEPAPALRLLNSACVVTLGSNFALPAVYDIALEAAMNE